MSGVLRLRPKVSIPWHIQRMTWQPIVSGGKPSGGLHSSLHHSCQQHGENQWQQRGERAGVGAPVADWLAWETFAAAPTSVEATFSSPNYHPANLGTHLYKAAKHQHKENQWQKDWILIFKSSHFGIMQPVFQCFSSPRLMRSPWEFVNRHRRWNCHISLAPVFWLSSEITQCGGSSAQGNHEFSTHYTYPLHLFYCAPYSKWHLIVLGKYLFLCKLP